MGFLSSKELSEVGFKALGKNVSISDKASIYNPQNISIGSNVRIDDFCILSGNICIGNFIHISAFCALYGGGQIFMEDFSGLSPRCTLLSASDDFSGEYMISPMVNPELTNVSIGKIHLKRFVQIGANSVVLPKVVLEEGSVIGALSLVNKNTDKWKIYGGIPIKLIRTRQKNIIQLSKKIVSDNNPTI